MEQKHGKCNKTQLNKLEDIQYKSQKRILVFMKCQVRSNKLHTSGLIEHHGVFINSGHYVSYIRQNNKWCLCDDKHITETNLITLSNNVYLVFYAKEKNLLRMQGGHKSFCYVAISFSPKQYFMCSRFCLVWTLLLCIWKTDGFAG